MKLETLVTLLSLVVSLCGCGAETSSTAPLCALDGTCPAGLYCSEGSCVSVPDAGNWQLGADVSAPGPDVADSDANAGPDVDAWLDTFDALQKQDAGGESQGAETREASQSVAALQASSGCKQSAGNLAGSPVSLSGVVVTSGVLQVGKYPTFFVRDETAPTQSGAHQGLKVFVSSGVVDVSPGDKLALSGELVEFYCETQLKIDADDVVVVGTLTAPSPYAVTTAQLTNDGESAELYEGVYVELSEVEVAQSDLKGTDGKTHGDFAVRPKGAEGPVAYVGPSSGTTFGSKDPQTGAMTSGFAVGHTFKKIRGHVTYSFGSYVLRPGDDKDMVSP